MKLTEIRQVLAARGIQLSRSLGQNFLHDANQLSRIAGEADLRPAERVLEIGPGLGPLTEQLLAAGANVLAIEKDARLVELLRSRFDPPRLEPASDHPAAAIGADEPAATPSVTETRIPERPRFELLHADALRWLEAEPRDFRGWKVVSNLPYSVASPILVELATLLEPPDRIVVTLQLEVAQRLAAAPGGRDYGILSLLVQVRYVPRLCFSISRECFFPAPAVDSACVCLDRRPTELLSPAERKVFGRVIKRAFSERRKKALKLLRHDWPADTLAQAWRDLGLDEQIRAERIALDQFAELTRRLASGPPPAA